MKATMLHISRKTDWQVGDTLVCGTRENPFWATCADFDLKTALEGEEMSFFTLFDRCPEMPVNKGNVKLLYDSLKKISKECALYIREQVFEDVRRESYPQLPSRQSCLWVCEAETLAHWKEIAPQLRRSVLTLELEGELFCGDDYWLEIDTFSAIEYAKRAHHYWAGEMSEQPCREYLFRGTAVVTHVELLPEAQSDAAT